jgi:hypothetical protein
MTEIVKQATMRNPAFWVCLSLSIGLIVAGFCVPPHGEIDGSVLTSCGILFAFATLETVHIAIKKGVDAKVKHGQTEVTVGDLNKDKNEDNYEETE